MESKKSGINLGKRVFFFLNKNSWIAEISYFVSIKYDIDKGYSKQAEFVNIFSF